MATDPGAGLAAAVLAAHLDWADRFEAGEIHDPDLSAEPGERVAVRVATALLADLAVAAVPAVTNVRARGALVATDRRVVILQAGADAPVEVRWDYERVGRVVTELTGLGTVIATPDGTQLWGFVPPLLLDPSVDRRGALLGLAQWMRVTAGWYAARGALDDWRDLTRTWFAPERLTGL